MSKYIISDDDDVEYTIGVNRGEGIFKERVKYHSRKTGESRSAGLEHTNHTDLSESAPRAARQMYLP